MRAEVLAHRYVERVRKAELVTLAGRVTSVMPTYLEASGPHAPVGSLCEIAGQGGVSLMAEIIGVDERRVALMPYAALHGVMVGDRVFARTRTAMAAVGEGFLGRVIDAMGRPLDGGKPVVATAERPLHGSFTSPLDRASPDQPVETGIRAIDALLTLGVGQRIGVFAGSGVGKTTLLSALARNVEADVRIVCLVGERGREAEEFWHRALDAEQRRHAIQIVATSDEPAVVRARAVFLALTLAEYFRDRGQHVLFILDSLTRLAMALRECGLAVGEPPTVRAYTPSVFATLPRVIERLGALRGAGAVTAIMSVLAETDDTEDPLCETIKALLDGHLILSRELAEQGHFPAIHVPRSVSRLFRRLTTETQQRAAAEAIAQLSVYDSSRALVESGVYRAGANAALDRALAGRERLIGFLRQPWHERNTRAETDGALAEVLETGADA